MKKLISHIISFATAASLLLVSTSAQVFAAGSPKGDTYDLKGQDISKAKYKPTISISQERLTNAEAKENPIRTVNVYISGADAAYASAGFTIKFDERLTLIKDKRGMIAKAGDALEYCAPTFVSDTDNGIRTIISSSDNMGLDGKMFSFHVELPDDISDEGEKFPIEVYYKKRDRFTNIDVDDDGQLMEAWLFTNGIENGFIEVQPKDAHVEPDPGIGDINGDGKVDSIDASRILAIFAYISTNSSGTDVSFAILDINGDHSIDSVDASLILAFYTLISSLKNPSSINFIDFLKSRNIW